MDDAEFPALNYREVGLNLVPYVPHNNILLLCCAFSCLESLLDAPPRVKVLQRQCTVEPLRVDHLHGALEASCA